MPKTGTAVIRVNADDWRRFRDIAEANDLTASQVLRKAIRDYIRANAQVDAFAKTTGGKKRGNNT